MDAGIRNEAPRDGAIGSLDVSVIIPVWSPDAPLRAVVEGLAQSLKDLGKSFEIILVFDGGKGDAWTEGQVLSHEHPGILRCIAFKQSFGQAACLMAGYEQSVGTVLVTSPPYNQVDPRDVSCLLEAIDDGADMVSPWRKSRADSPINRWQSRLFNGLMRLMTRTHFHDLNCYFRGMRREVLEGLTVYGDMYRFLPVLASRKGYRVDEVEVRHISEWGGRGLFGVAVYIRRLLDVIGVMFLTRFTLRPLRFFGTLGALFVTLGLGITTWLFVRRFVFDQVGFYGHPMFLIGMLFLVLGVQVFGFGLVGEIIIYTQARNLKEYKIERIYE